jgi:hypothetical protein
MLYRLRSLLIFLLLLIPSARFFWRNRDMPEFAFLHDDGIQYLTGKSLAQGAGYRVSSLPEAPAETKYPPLFPLYLSIIWRLNPSFPDNLRLASMFLWTLMITLVALAWVLYARVGLPRWKYYTLGALLALNPYLILFGVTPFSEVFFTCFVLLTFVLIESARPTWIFAAGVIAGCAYLSRTAGIALLTVPIWLLWRKQRKEAAIFLSAMSPFVIGWSLWSRSEMQAGSDITLVYYVDYLRYQFLNVGLDNVAVVLYKNFDQALYGIGSLILPKVIDFSPVKILTQTIGIASIVGVVRLVRRGVMVPYALFAFTSLLILVFWHFPPNERFVLPLLPLIALGFVEELEQLVRNLKLAFRHRDKSQRVAARVLASVAALLVAAIIGLQCFVTFSFLDESVRQKRAKLQDLTKAYSWISSNLSPSARILSYDDPLMYLYTGHQGNYLPLLPRFWYAEDHKKIVQAYRDLAEYCRSRGLDYIYFTTEDPGREVGEYDREKIAEAVKSNRQLTPLFHAGIGTLYRINTIPIANATSSPAR